MKKSINTVWKPKVGVGSSSLVEVPLGDKWPIQNILSELLHSCRVLKIDSYRKLQSWEACKASVWLEWEVISCGTSVDHWNSMFLTQTSVSPPFITYWLQFFLCLIRMTSSWYHMTSVRTLIFIHCYITRAKNKSCHIVGTQWTKWVHECARTRVWILALRLFIPVAMGSVFTCSNAQFLHL